MGVLQGTGAYKCGRACIVVPESKIDEVSNVIRASGGLVTSIAPNILPREEFERSTRQIYRNNLEILRHLLDSASKAADVKSFEDSMDKSIRLAGKFEAYIREASEYAERKPKISYLQQFFKGLKSISKTDLEAAKIQAEFFEKELENEFRSMSKVSEK